MSTDYNKADKKLLTIITPSYNRGHTLTKVYDSLKNQTSKNFVWLVVDDGSSDNTEVLINRFIEESLIKIIYKKKKNGGKASALNVAISMLNTEYAVCLDSDDVFFPNAVELSLKQLESVKDNSQCCGILALRNNPDGTVMGDREIPQNIRKITAVDVFLKLCLNTELICFYKSSILQKFRFPEFEGEKFVSPAWMQYAVTQEHYFRTSWDRLCCCEYEADGLTRNKRAIIIKNPKGYTCVKRFSYALSPTLKTKIKHGIMYEYGRILCGEINFVDSPHRILSCILRPIAWCVYILRNHQNKPG